MAILTAANDVNTVAITAPTQIDFSDVNGLIVGVVDGVTGLSTTNGPIRLAMNDLDIQQAVNAPRFHNQWLPDVLYVERWFSPDTVEALQKMEYHVQFGLRDGPDAGGYWSDAECIAVDPQTGERLGASDGRNNGKAVGY